jgi:hypothetical protein
MSPQAALKLVKPQPASARPDVLRFERRRAPRHSAAGRVTAVQQPADPATQNAKICSLRLLNISDTGLGALSDEAVDTGSVLTVYFPSHGADAGFDLFGQVVRCVRRETGHEIGILLSRRQAA